MNRWKPSGKAKLPAAGVAAVIVAVVSSVSISAERQDWWAKYRVLTQRNIFRRDRKPVRPRGPAASRPAKGNSYDSDRNVVLTGVARGGGEFVAFFEDARTGVTSKIRIGRPIGKGRVKTITLNGVEYERAGTVRKLKVGVDLTGAIKVVRAEPTVAGAAAEADRPPREGGKATTSSSQPTSSPGITPSGASPSRAAEASTTAILERMCRRRQRELRR